MQLKKKYSAVRARVNPIDLRLDVVIRLSHRGARVSSR
jgi:hypothetical protein